ncbi:MAG: TlpA disulfide reductase family protein [Saprospiraceae bacterium]
MMNKFFLFCAFLTLMMFVNTVSAQKVSKVYHKYSQLAPRLEPDFDDETIYVVSFFATWCVQCRKEIPEMVKLDRKYRNNPKVKILFVNLDDASRQRKVRPFLKKHKITGEVVSLVDPNQEKWITAIKKNWNGSLPGTLFIKGFNRKFYNYPMTYQELERNISFMENK